MLWNYIFICALKWVSSNEKKTVRKCGQREYMLDWDHQETYDWVWYHIYGHPFFLLKTLKIIYVLQATRCKVY